MSVDVMSLVWKNAAVKGNTLLVLLAMADWSSDDGVCWPSVITLAAKSRQSERSVQYALRDLTKDNLIRLIPGNKKTPTYQIMVQNLQGAKIAPGAKVSASGVQNATEKVLQIAPDTSVTHQRDVTLALDVIEKIRLAYPRKTDVEAARKAITKSIGKIAAERKLSVLDAARWLYARVVKFSKSYAGNRGEFTKHCATWMNKGSYNDDDREWNEGGVTAAPAAGRDDNFDRMMQGMAVQRG